ncbi:hypothetical protein B4100_2414 [Heyndrickxia coagulans]|nr:hypothetical protein B4100_2414 [Heyndrickxia coagulans]
MHIYKCSSVFASSPRTNLPNDDFLRQAKERQYFVHFI